jgi:hypothetical protein
VRLEWIEWSSEVANACPDVADAVARFEAPGDREAGRAATEWLRERAADAHPGCVTRLLLADGEIQGYYSTSMSEVKLNSRHQDELGEQHPRQGAVLIAWLARSNDALVDNVANHLLLHAMGSAREHATAVGATVLALDPYDEETAELCRKKYKFKTSQTDRGSKPRRLWVPLFPGR